MKKYKFFKISSIASLAIGLLIVVLYISGEGNDSSWFNNIFNGLFVKNGSGWTAEDVSNMLLLLSLIFLIFGFVMMLLTYRKYNDAYVAARHDANINRHIAKTLAMKQLREEEKKKAKAQLKAQRKTAKLERAKKRAEELAKKLAEQETDTQNSTFVEEEKVLPKVTTNNNTSTTSSQTNQLLNRMKNGR